MVAPTLDLNGGNPGTSNTISYTEGDPETAIAPNATVSDPDTSDFFGGSLIVDITAGEGEGDRIDVTGAFTIDEGSLFYNGIRIGSVTGGLDGSPLTILFDQVVDPDNGTTVTLSIVEELIRSITYSNLLTSVQSGTRTIAFMLNDGTASSTPVTADVNVTAIETPPIAEDDSVSTPEDSVLMGSVFNDNGSGFDRDPDGDQIFVTSVNGNAANVGQTITLTSGALLKLNDDGTFTYDPNGAFADTPYPESGAVNGTVNDSFTYTITGGDGATVTVQIVGETDPSDVYRGDSGDNVIIGTNFRDIFRLEQGGSDAAFGLLGIDSFYFGGAFDPSDSVDGGGEFDVLILQGHYGRGLTIGNITGIESISLFPGNNTSYGDTAGNFYSYNLTILDSVVPAGGTLRINGSGLRLGESLTFDGSAETNGGFLIYAGMCDDDLTGGAQNDIFLFGPDGRFGAFDVIDGRGGYDVVYLRGDYAIDFRGVVLLEELTDVRIEGVGGVERLTKTFDPIQINAGPDFIYSSPSALTNVESVGLLSATDPNFAMTGGDGENDYWIIFADAMLAAGATITFNGSRLNASETFVFDGSEETLGNFRLFAGAADDTLTGGGGNDLLYGGDGADLLVGGGGIDTFRYQATSESTLIAADVIDGFVTLVDKVDLQRIDANVHLEGDQGFTRIGAAAFTGAGAASAGELRVYEHGRNPGTWYAEGDTNGDGIADLVIVFINTPQLQPGDFLP